MMEGSIFPRAAVADLLEHGFVEARLHTDGGPAKAANRARQAALAGTIALPVYVVLDPASGAELGQLEGATTEARFVEFLRGARP